MYMYMPLRTSTAQARHAKVHLTKKMILVIFPAFRNQVFYIIKMVWIVRILIAKVASLYLQKPTETNINTQVIDLTNRISVNIYTLGHLET